MEASALRRGRGAVVPRSRRLLAAFGDDRLVDQIRRGNDAAFEVVYDRHHRGILAFCRHMLGSPEEAEDALQQTFAAAYADLGKDAREIRLKPWLYTIARNRCLSILRSRREQPAELDEDKLATAGLADEVQRRADLRDLLRDLRGLPDDQREALVLFELGDLSHVEIGDVIGVPAVKVKALVFQARSALIEQREARSIPCAEIREQLATASGGALRRGPLRRHLKSCPGCREYRKQVRSQRRALAALLPVAPSVGLKAAVIGAGAGGGAAATGGGVFASLGTAKIVVSAAIAGTAVAGGGVAVEQAVHHHRHPSAPSSAHATKTPRVKASESQSVTHAGVGAPTPPRRSGPSPVAALPAAVPVSERSQRHIAKKKKKAKRRHHRGRRGGASAVFHQQQGERGHRGPGSGHGNGGRGNGGTGNGGGEGRGHGGGHGGGAKNEQPASGGASGSGDGGDKGSSGSAESPGSGGGKGNSGSGSGNSSGSSGSGDDPGERVGEAPG